MLNREQIKYIEENIDKESIERIAKKLSIKTKRLKKELARINLKPAKKEPKPFVLSFTPPSISKKNRVIVVLLAFIVVFLSALCYMNSLENDFIWDDEYLILLNSQIKSFSHFFDAFKTYVGYGSGNVNNFYRPLQELSNMLDYSIWKENPKGYHLTNLVLHSLTAGAILFFVFYITGNLFVSFFTGLLFGVHTINTEAVSYVAGRADSLYALFFVLSIVFYIMFANKLLQHNKKISLYILSLICFTLSIFAKELALILPVLILLYLFVILRGRIPGPTFRFLTKTVTGYGALILMFGAMRNSALHGVNAPVSVFVRVPLFARVLTFFKSILVYFELLIYPHGLHMERRISISTSLFHPVTLISFIMVVVIIWFGFWMLKRDRTVSFFIFWFFVSLLPVSNIVPINSLIAEHWVYTAQIGFFAVILMLFYQLSERFLKHKILKAGGVVLLCIPVCFYMYRTIERNKDWKDEITFFKATLKYNPTNSKVHLNLGNTYYENEMFDEALAQYNKTIELRKDYFEAYGNIGSIYIRKKDFKKAKEYLKTAISMKPEFAIAHYNLGYIYYNERKLEESEKELKLAAKHFPSLYAAHNLLGRLYLRKKNKPEAKRQFQISLKIHPGQPEIQKLVNKL